MVEANGTIHLDWLKRRLIEEILIRDLLCKSEEVGSQRHCRWYGCLQLGVKMVCCGRGRTCCVPGFQKALMVFKPMKQLASFAPFPTSLIGYSQKHVNMDLESVMSDKALLASLSREYELLKATNGAWMRSFAT